MRLARFVLFSLFEVQDLIVQASRRLEEHVSTLVDSFFEALALSDQRYLDLKKSTEATIRRTVQVCNEMEENLLFT
jgi:hypothetical protein